MIVNLFFVQAICGRILRIDGLDDDLRRRLFAHLKVCSDKRHEAELEPDSPYTAVAHCDVWTNNIMFSTGKYNQHNLQSISKQKTMIITFTKKNYYIIFS